MAVEVGERGARESGRGGDLRSRPGGEARPRERLGSRADLDELKLFALLEEPPRDAREDVEALARSGAADVEQIGRSSQPRAG